MKKTKNKKTASTQYKPVIAKSDNGNISINFTIPFDRIDKSRKKAVTDLGKNVDVPGFRKGKAPFDKLVRQIPQNKLLENTLIQILPKMLADVVKEHNLKLAIYPKFEVLEAEDDKDWKISAKTAEFPEFKLGDYAKNVKGALASKSLWTPQNKKGGKPPTQTEKEQITLKALLDNVKVTVPPLLIEEETNSRLAQLLERIEKLGLTLESYLASTKKTVEEIKDDYKRQSEEAIKVDVILSRIAQHKNISVAEDEIEQVLNVSKADEKFANELDTPERRRAIEAVLLKRKALDILISS